MIKANCIRVKFISFFSWDSDMEKIVPEIVFNRMKTKITRDKGVPRGADERDGSKRVSRASSEPG